VLRISPISSSLNRAKHLACEDEGQEWGRSVEDVGGGRETLDQEGESRPPEATLVIGEAVV
jgi:hypothetical protein